MCIYLIVVSSLFFFSFFFFNDTATTEIYPLSLHDALPISSAVHNFWKALARLNVFSAHELESLPAVMALYAPSTALIASFKRFRSALIWHAVSSSSTTNTRMFCPGWAAL